MICEYGCGQEANYQLKNRKWCCEPHYLKCKKMKDSRKGSNNPFYGKTHTSVYKEKLKEKMTGKKMPVFKNIENDKKIYCKFGCGRIAKFVSINEEYYCENNSSKCSVIKNINRNKNIGSKNSKRQKFKKFKNTDNKLCDYGCNQVAEYINKNGKVCCSEYTTQCKRRTTKYTIDDYKEKYPLFSKIEDLRYNPDKPEEKEIQVHCKYSECENSKEKGGWFAPTSTQLYERIRAIFKPSSEFVENNFYCSKKCKEKCILYRKKSDPFKDKEINYTSEEYQTFRNYVLTRDNNICQFCGQQATDVHHERPKKLEPFFSLDPDFAWSCCEKCHYEKGHKDECSTGNLANKICSKQ